MRILPITNNYRNYQVKRLDKPEEPIEKTNPSFNGWELNVLDKSEKEVLNIAKSFYKSTDAELREVSAVRTFIFGIKKAAKSEAAYYKLLNAVNKVKRDVANLEQQIQAIENKFYKSFADEHRLADLKKQVAEYEQCFKLRARFYKEYGYTSDDDWDSAIDLAKADGSWYDY